MKNSREYHVAFAMLLALAGCNPPPHPGGPASGPAPGNAAIAVSDSAAVVGSALLTLRNAGMISASDNLSVRSYQRAGNGYLLRLVHVAPPGVVMLGGAYVVKVDSAGIGRIVEAEQ